MLVGRQTEELAESGRRRVLERRRHRARIAGPGASGATGEDPGKPHQDRALESATGQYPRRGRTRRATGSLHVGVHAGAVLDPAGRSAAHGSLQPPGQRASPATAIRSRGRCSIKSISWGLDREMERILETARSKTLQTSGSHRRGTLLSIFEIARYDRFGARPDRATARRWPG